MTDPLTALMAFVALALLAAGLAWPKRGLVARLLRSTRASERVLVEDALKHLHDCEYRGLSCTLDSLRGALDLSGKRATRLLTRLMQLRLVDGRDRRYRLTGDGRRYALRVIRIHRLWERYLSDRTGLSELEWHAIADAREHTTSAADAELLAARMCYPRFDPHGDPIPTVDGDLPPARGVPLPSLGVGQRGEIVHVEDEPHAIYAQLVAEGLDLGMRFSVIESTPERVCFDIDGETHVLAPVVASNLSVVPLAIEPSEVSPSGTGRLSSLRLGQRGQIRGLSQRLRGVPRRRMLDLGFIPGTPIEVVMHSPAGDPTAYRLRGAVIALRRDQADLIEIDRVDVEHRPPPDDEQNALEQRSPEAA